MSRGPIDILVVGVGGQGVILASAIIAEVALLQGGLEVKMSETHGMSQRGGSVHAHIRIGEHLAAPVTSPGEVDYLLAFEAAEGLRWAPALAAGGVAIVNTKEIVPPLAGDGVHVYPRDALARMAGRGFDVVAVDGDAVGREAGSVKVAGVVLLGALSNHLPFAEATWRQAITSTVSPGWLTMNLAALAAGRQLEAA